MSDHKKPSYLKEELIEKMMDYYCPVCGKMLKPYGMKELKCPLGHVFGIQSLHNFLYPRSLLRSRAASVPPTP